MKDDNREPWVMDNCRLVEMGVGEMTKRSTRNGRDPLVLNGADIG